MQNIEIRPANGRTDLLDIYRFRYSIYHEEMKKPEPYADQYGVHVSTLTH